MLKPQQILRYNQHGVAFPIRVFSENDAAQFRAHCDALEEALGGKPNAMKLAQTHLHFGWAYDLATHPRILDAVEDILGPNLIVWAASIFPKHSHDPAYISWHQDGTYWGLDSDQVTTAWIALTPSTVENGCMRVVEGSQRQDILPHVETDAEHNLLSRGQEVSVDVAEREATDVILQAGEMSLHHVRLIHGSNPNRSGDKRTGFVIRYVTPAVSQVGHRPQAVLARGADNGNHFELVGRPPERSFDDALTAHQLSAQQLLDSVMQDRG